MLHGGRFIRTVIESPDNIDGSNPFQTLPRIAHKHYETRSIQVLRTTGLAGVEPTAYRLGGGRSIHLSYNPN